jgi:choline dehydrogenase-like flavoprotein
MFSSSLDTEQRDEALACLAKDQFDILVIGGGVTGVGAALDAASRGLKVALVEASDIASGTSSRSSKLIHGGLRYLEQYDLPKQNQNNPYAAVIPIFCKSFIENKQPTINGDGETSRDFTFVENAVQANICALLYKNLQKHDGPVLFEPIADTWLDICGYSVIALLWIRGWFMLELESEVK